MRQAVLIAPKTFRLDTVAASALGPADVRVKVRASGICASEIHAWEDGEGAPRLLGHEVAGEVVEAGAASGFRLGERVTGLFNQGFSDQVVTPAERVALIPENLDFADAHGEPIACAMSAARRTRLELGDRIAVVGLGFMGLLMLQMLRVKGPAEIVGIDIRDDALAAGLRLGCDRVLKPAEIEPDKLAVFPFAPGDTRGFDVVIEATGTQPGLDLASDLVKWHGVLSILGYHQGGPRRVDMRLWNFKAIDVLNAHERRPDFRMDCMRRGLALAAAGRLDLSALTTHRFPLERVGDAFAALADKPKGFIKSVIVID